MLPRGSRLESVPQITPEAFFFSELRAVSRDSELRHGSAKISSLKNSHITYCIINKLHAVYPSREIRLLLPQMRHVTICKYMS